MSEYWSEELITDYLDDRLTQPERERVEAHLQQHPRDAELLEEFLQLRKALAAAPSYQLDRGFSDRVMQAIETTREPLPAATSTSVIAQPESGTHWRMVLGVMTAIAAMLVLGIFFFPRPSQPVADGRVNERDQDARIADRAESAENAPAPGSATDSPAELQDDKAISDSEDREENDMLETADLDALDSRQPQENKPPEMKANRGMEASRARQARGNQPDPAQRSRRAPAQTNSRSETLTDSIAMGQKTEGDRQEEAGQTSGAADEFADKRMLSTVEEAESEAGAIEKSAEAAGQADGQWSSPRFRGYEVVVVNAAATPDNLATIDGLDQPSRKQSLVPEPRSDSGLLSKQATGADMVEKERKEKKDATGSDQTRVAGGMADGNTADDEADGPVGGRPASEQISDDANQRQTETVVFEIDATKAEFLAIVESINGQPVPMDADEQVALVQRYQLTSDDGKSDQLEKTAGGGGGFGGGGLGLGGGAGGGMEKAPGEQTRESSLSDSPRIHRLVPATDSDTVLNPGLAQMQDREAVDDDVDSEIDDQRRGGSRDLAQPGNRRLAQMTAPQNERPTGQSAQEQRRQRFLLVIRLPGSNGQAAPPAADRQPEPEN